jgi:short-subunit dehydrogenase
LVTGASSGIGQDFARLLAEHHHDLLLVARRTEPMERLAEELRAARGVAVTVTCADLADPAAPARLVDRIAELDIEVDVLVNNAGYMLDGHFLKFSWAQNEAYARVLALAPAELIHRLLPGMLRRGWGQVINIASAAGFMPATPFNSLYGPVKNYLVVLTRTLAAEYGAAGITFTVCCPGVVSDTGIIDTAHGHGWSRLGPLLCTPRQVTSAAYHAAERGRTVVAVGVASRGLAALGHVLPSSVLARLIGASVMFLSKEKPITSAAQIDVDTAAIKPANNVRSPDGRHHPR